MLCVKDFEKYAAQNLPAQTWIFYSSGAEREDTLKDNEEAFRRYKFLPRMLRNKTEVDVSTTILGEKISFPVGFAPTACQKLAHPDGEIAAAKAAAAMNTVYTLSTISNTALDDLAESVPNSLRWMQVYLLKDLDASKRMIKKAEKYGYKALVLTIDHPLGGIHLKAWKDGLPDITRLTLPQMPTDDWEPEYIEQITWDHVSMLKTISNLPIVVKGILTAEDAKLAVQHGASAVWVSNQGARQLDGTLATIDALEPIVHALKGTKCEVYLDSGIRWGSDVLKALALGAKAVFIGRPILWGLAHSGEDGARKILEILKKELIITMKLSGCQNLDEVGPSLLYKTPRSVL